MKNIKSITDLEKESGLPIPPGGLEGYSKGRIPFGNYGVHSLHMLVKNKDVWYYRIDLGLDKFRFGIDDIGRAVLLEITEKIKSYKPLLIDFDEWDFGGVSFLFSLDNAQKIHADFVSLVRYYGCESEIRQKEREIEFLKENIIELEEKKEKYDQF